MSSTNDLELITDPNDIPDNGVNDEEQVHNSEPVIIGGDQDFFDGDDDENDEDDLLEDEPTDQEAAGELDEDKAEG